VSEIIEATSEDQIEQVRNLFAEYRAQLPVDYCARGFDNELAALPGVYAPPEGSLLLALVMGQPVGCVGLRPFPLAGACEMKRLYVRPPFRGGDVGKKLVDGVLQKARELGILDAAPRHASAHDASGAEDLQKAGLSRGPARSVGAGRGVSVYGAAAARRLAVVTAAILCTRKLLKRNDRPWASTILP